MSNRRQLPGDGLVTFSSPPKPSPATPISGRTSPMAGCLCRPRLLSLPAGSHRLPYCRRRREAPLETAHDPAGRQRQFPPSGAQAERQPALPGLRRRTHGCASCTSSIKACAKPGPFGCRRSGLLGLALPHGQHAPPSHAGLRRRQSRRAHRDPVARKGQADRLELVSQAEQESAERYRRPGGRSLRGHRSPAKKRLRRGTRVRTRWRRTGRTSCGSWTCTTEERQ